MTAKVQHPRSTKDNPTTGSLNAVNYTKSPAAPFLRILMTWFRQELVLLLREPVAIFFSLGFPLVIYVFIGIPYANEVLPGGARFIDVMFPALLGTVAANLLLMGLPIYLAELRIRSVVRRYRVLPLPGSLFAMATLLSMLVLVAAACGIVMAVIASQHGLLPNVWRWQFIALTLGVIGWLSAVGFLLGTLPAGSRTIQALSAALFFILFFGSGAAAPIDGLPSAIQTVLQWNPLKQWFDVMIGVYTGMEVITAQWLRLWIALPLSISCVVLGLRFWKRA